MIKAPVSVRDSFYRAMIDMYKNNNKNNNKNNDEVKAIIESKVIPVYNEFDMLLACYTCNSEIIDLVAKLCIETNTEDEAWWIFHNCLHTACREGHYKTVKLMLDKGAVFTDIDYEDETRDDDIYGDYRAYGVSLDNACKKGYFITIKVITNKDFYDWDRGLLAACRSGNKQIIRYMVSKGATGWEECLEDACGQGNYKMAKFVIKNCTNERNNDIFQNCFRMACEHGYFEILELLLSSSNYDFDWDIGLKNACRGGHFEIIKLMISKGADDWYNGFKAASLSKHLEIAKFMITKGLCLVSGLILASEYSFLEMVKFIIVKNKRTFAVADLNTALSRLSGSAWGGEKTTEIAKLLISEGATNLANKLYYAFDRTHISFFQLILDNVDELSVKLLNSVLCGHKGSYEHDFLRILLINKGADVSDLEVGEYLDKAKSFQLYCLYCRKSKKDVLNNEKFDKLLQVYPPYVLLKASRTKIIKICTSRLPSDLFRLLFTYLH